VGCQLPFSRSEKEGTATVSEPRGPVQRDAVKKLLAELEKESP
jgi:hypothetical protein